MRPNPPAGVTQLVECQPSNLNVASSILAFRSNAKVVKLVDTLVLGTSGLGRGGSTPSCGTTSRDGETGKHIGFKPRRHWACGFDSRSRHKMERWQSG